MEAADHVQEHLESHREHRHGDVAWPQVGWSSLLSITSERRPLREFVEENNFFPKFFHPCNGLALVN